MLHARFRGAPADALAGKLDRSVRGAAFFLVPGIYDDSDWYQFRFFLPADGDAVRFAAAVDSGAARRRSGLDRDGGGDAAVGGEFTFCALAHLGVIKKEDTCINHTMAGDLEIEVGDGYVMMDMAEPKEISTISDEDSLRILLINS